MASDLPDPKSLVFDLDGTLIDSSSSILEGLRGAFAACRRRPARPLAAELIGPPLRETLALLADSEDEAVLHPLAEAFKSHYDGQGYRLTRVFPGVADLLGRLAAANYPMFIATNKRLQPTRLIVEHLGWGGFFRGIYALDAFDPPLANKSAVLGRVLAIHELDARATLYVGDRDEDGVAATANAIPFAWASWGYGAREDAAPAAEFRLDEPADLWRRLNPDRPAGKHRP